MHHIQSSSFNIQGKHGPQENVPCCILNVLLRYFPAAREEFAQGKPHDSPAVPVLLQFFCKLGSDLIEGGDVLILKLDRHLDEAVFVLLVPGVFVSAVFVMLVGMIV